MNYYLMRDGVLEDFERKLSDFKRSVFFICLDGFFKSCEYM